MFVKWKYKFMCAESFTVFTSILKQLKVLFGQKLSQNSVNMYSYHKKLHSETDKSN